jgi:hypothetical protein
MGIGNFEGKESQPNYPSIKKVSFYGMLFILLLSIPTFSTRAFGTVQHSFN